MKENKKLTWDEKFELLKEYRNEFGDCNVPNGYRYKGFGLGAWVGTQRLANKENNTVTKKLNQDQIDKLDSIGFVWDLAYVRWNEKFELLKQYKEEFGDCIVPSKYKYKGINLSDWVLRQRREYKDFHNFKYYYGPMTQEKIDKLNSIGFIWENYKLSELRKSEKIEKVWKKHFKLLKKYKEEFGDCIVPSKYKYKGVNLGLWVSKQRIAFNKNKLEPEKIYMLNSIGFIWNINMYQWNKKFELLKQYKEKFGDCNVPYNYEYKDVALGSWVIQQRERFKNIRKRNNILKEDIEKINKLESIGFIWKKIK